MSRPAYSSLLWEFSPPGTGTFHSSVVPGGFLWVVRDIDAFAPGPPYTPLVGLYFSDNFGAQFATFPNGYAFGGQQCEWRGRQILEAGDRISALAGDGGWNWRVSGYVLTI